MRTKVTDKAEYIASTSEFMGDDSNEKIITPVRPPARLKGLYIELDHNGRSREAFTFGEVEKLNSSDMIAKDDEGNAVMTDAEALFGDDDNDADHNRLVRYLDIADRESFLSSSLDEEHLPPFRQSVDGFVLERPIVRTAADAAKFPPGHCRIWLKGGAWDGMTLLEHAVDDGLFDASRASAIAEAAAKGLRADALGHALAPFPDRDDLLARIFSM
jgi:hypothetical protein